MPLYCIDSGYVVNSTYSFALIILKSLQTVTTWNEDVPVIFVKFLNDFFFTFLAV